MAYKVVYTRYPTGGAYCAPSDLLSLLLRGGKGLRPLPWEEKKEKSAPMTADEVNWTEQPIGFVTLTRVTNSASCNWVNLVQVSSVQLVR